MTAATYATLAGEPFCLTMAAIAGLTDRQIAEVYSHPRKDGVVEMPAPPPPAEEVDDETAFRVACAALGVPAEEAERRIAERRARREHHP